MITLKAGDEIYYTGDMANFPAYGKITKVYSDKYGHFVDIEYHPEDGETKPASRRLFQASFLPGPGRRFMLKSERLAQQKAGLEQMQARLSC